MMLILGGIIILILAGIGFFMFGNQTFNSASTSQTPESTVPTVAAEQPASSQDVPPTGEAVVNDAAVATKTFSVSAKNFSFTPSEIRVKQGEKVVINFTTASGFHDFVIDELNVKTKQLSDGQTEEIEFVSDKKGTFEYYCSVGNHRKMGMVGKLIVE